MYKTHQPFNVRKQFFWPAMGLELYTPALEQTVQQYVTDYGRQKERGRERETEKEREQRILPTFSLFLVPFSFSGEISN